MGHVPKYNPSTPLRPRKKGSTRVTSLVIQNSDWPSGNVVHLRTMQVCGSLERVVARSSRLVHSRRQVHHLACYVTSVRSLQDRRIIIPTRVHSGIEAAVLGRFMPKNMSGRRGLKVGRSSPLVRFQSRIFALNKNQCSTLAMQMCTRIAATMRRRSSPLSRLQHALTYSATPGETGRPLCSTSRL